MKNKKIIFASILALGFFLSIENTQAFSPVARFDMVPYQRIEHGSSLKIGVVAFSKPGIQKVEFSATGQGYSGGTKTVTQMSLNDTSGVWEYWTTFSGSEFTGNGSITITALVTDKQNNTRNLTLPMFAYGASAFSPVKIWIDSVGGNNSTCAVNNEAAPCKTFATAMTKIKAANGGNCDGAIIYLQEGIYPTEGIGITSSAQWLTITKDPDADRSKVVITGGSSRFYSGYVKFDSVTMQSLGASAYVISSPTRLWTNNCRKMGYGRWTSNSNPIQFSNPDYHWSTNDYTYDVDFAYQRAALVRGATIDTVGNDTFQNTRMVVNSTMTNSDHGTNYSTHNDGYQFFNTNADSPPADNRIVYNYKATDMHYQGIFLHSELGLQSTNNAFVNVVMEMRDDANKNESNNYPFTGLGLYDPWDHLIIWNCSFLWGNSAIYTSNLTNSSIVGNVFFSLENTETSAGNPVVTSMAPGNAGNNEVLHNHFEWVYGVSPSCSSLARSNDALYDPDKPCPRSFAKRPDSDVGVSSTVGGEVVEMDNQSASFLHPIGNTLIDRFTSRVPVDVHNVARGALSDVGAMEHTSQTTPTPTCSDNIQNQNETGIDCGGVCPACQIAPPAPTTYSLTNFISLVQNWLGIGNSTSDVNNDGIVNTRDLGIMMSSWSQ